MAAREPLATEESSGVRALSARGAPATQSDALCVHCRSPLPAYEQSGFCCSGCRQVHMLLRSEGLERYYQLRGARALAPVPVRNGQRDHAWLDALLAESTNQGARCLSLDVQGIQCAACVWLIQALFKRQPEALAVQLNPALGRLSLLVGPRFPLRAFVRTLEELGYLLGPAKRGAARERDSLYLRAGICAALAGNTMFLAAATYLGLDAGPLHEIVENAGFASATLSALVGGSYFIERALLGLRRGVLHLDLPIAVGMLLSYLGSVWSFAFGDGAGTYFDTVSVFIALMLAGRLLQERLIEQNKRQLLESEGASSLLARRLCGGRTEFVPCGALACGDRLLVCPGEIVPVRARLVHEAASLGLDWITGESEPREARAGDELPAGAVNVGSAAFEVAALARFESSELDLLLRDDGSQKQRLRGDFWDRTARIYVGAVLLAAALGVVGYALAGAPLTRVLDVATAVLVVTCPCAFGIAVPLSYELAVAGLRRRGLFVRDVGFFERAARVRRIVFDKTGTLTSGLPALERPEVLDTLAARERAILYALVAHSNHPKSTAIAHALQARDPSLRLSPLTVTELPGMGVECSVDGVRYRCGAARWAAVSEPGLTSGVVFSAGGIPRATLELSELARPHAAEELRALALAGYELWIASGDRDARVKQMAHALPIARARALGDLTPEDKRRLIERIDQRDTLMLGDGINDAPALSRAFCSGTPAIDRPFVPSRADFYFLTPGLAPVRLALRVAAHLRGVVRRSLWFAGLYNVAAVALAYAGLMRPWLAAVLMPASSLAVLGFVSFALSTRRTLWRS